MFRKITVIKYCLSKCWLYLCRVNKAHYQKLEVMLISKRVENECFGIEYSLTHFPAEHMEVSLYSCGEDENGKYWVIETMGGYRARISSDIETYMI